MLVPLIPAFIKLYPEITPELILNDANLDLVGDRIDLALRLSPRMAQDSVRVKWFDYRYVLCASPAYIARHTAVVEPSDLEKHRCVLFGHPNSQSTWNIREGAGATLAIVVVPAAVASNGLAQKALVLAGMGPALIPMWLAEPELASGALVQLMPGYTATPGDFEGAAWLLYPHRGFLPAKTRAIVSFLQENVAKEWTNG